MHLYKTLFRTILTKGSGSVISFLIVILTSKFLGGANGRGDVSLVVLNLTVILLFSDLLGGSVLVYMTPRHRLLSLLLPAWTWGVVCALAGVLIWYLLAPMPFWEFACFAGSSVCLNTAGANCMALNGKEKIRENNICTLVQVGSLLVCLATGIFTFHLREPSLFYVSLLISYVLTLGLSFFFLRNDFGGKTTEGAYALFGTLMKNGLSLQLGNAVQLLNYRVAYYLLDHFHTKADVGIYSTGASVCESVWVISNGISMVQYARIANMKDPQQAQEFSISLSKMSFLGTALCILILLLLPSSLFAAIFGPEFAYLPRVILFLSAGVASFGFTCIHSHYFSGVGKLRVASYSSVVGFAVTLVCGFLLIPRYGIDGAAITACISYLASSAYLIVMFQRESGKSYRSLLLSYSEIFSSIKNLKNYVRDQRDH